MRSFTESLLNLPLALSAFGLNQALRVTNPLTGISKASTSFYRLGQAASEGFQPNPIFFGAFQLGDEAQRAATNLAFDVLTLRAFSPANLAARSTAVAGIGKDALASLSSRESLRLTWEEIQNKIGVIRLVNDVENILGFSANRPFEIRAALEKSYDQGEYPVIWLVEGCGERFTATSLESGQPLRGLLTSPPPGVPVKSLLMMHAGMGIALARHMHKSVTPYSCSQDIEWALRTFITAVRENSKAGYGGAALESLGLVTRTWHQEMVPAISTGLASIDPIARAHFWHGAGRAMFFSAPSMVPGFSPWRSTLTETSDEDALRNAQAGVAWAFTLVNIEHPEIAAGLFERKNDALPASDAFTNGALSTLTMASDMVPGNAVVAKFCSWRPDSNVSEIWNQRYGSNPAASVARKLSILSAGNALGDLFRYRAGTGAQ